MPSHVARSLNGGVRVVSCLPRTARGVQAVDIIDVFGRRFARGAGVYSPPLVPTSDGLSTLFQQRAGALATTPEERRTQRCIVDSGPVSSGSRCSLAGLSNWLINRKRKGTWDHVISAG